MARTLSYTETLEVTRCWCGIALAVPENLLRHAHNDGQTIYCPLGHQFSWRETEADRLKKKLNTAEEQRLAAEQRASFWYDEHEREKKSHSTTKGQLTKAKKRANNGVCQECHRSFPDLAEHVRSKHPDQAPVTERVLP